MKKAWDKIHGKVVRSSWEKIGLLLPFFPSTSRETTRGPRRKKFRCPRDVPLHADAGAEEGAPAARAADFLEVWDINDDDDTGWSWRATTTPLLKKWEGVWDWKPEMGLTRRLARGADGTPVVDLTYSVVAAYRYEIVWVCSLYPVALVTPGWVKCCGP